MKRNILALIVVFVCLKISGIESPDKLVRTQMSFNNDWKFILADSPDFRNPEFNDIYWRILDLPHDWSIEGAIDKKAGGSDGFFPQGVGWYRKHFILPDSLKPAAIKLESEKLKSFQIQLQSR